MTVFPDIVTFPPSTGIAWTVLLSDDFLRVILPLPATTFSLKVRTMFELTATPVALSAGELDESVGAATSATVKFNVVLSFIPGKELPPVSSIAVASTFT